MTNEEKYHTCGRCKWEDSSFICHQCKWGEDTRKDLWEPKVEHKYFKAGYWVSSSNGWMCSNCWEDASHEFDFCPHCGADMRVTRESKEGVSDEK